jgi:hypothetical protein
LSYINKEDVKKVPSKSIRKFEEYTSKIFEYIPLKKDEKLLCVNRNNDNIE